MSTRNDLEKLAHHLKCEYIFLVLFLVKKQSPKYDMSRSSSNNNNNNNNNNNSNTNNNTNNNYNINNNNSNNK